MESLKRKIQEELPLIFHKMKEQDTSWVGYDAHSTFYTYGYGHALIALNRLRTNLFELGIYTLLSVGVPLWDKAAQRSANIVLDPGSVQVYEVLEFSMALQAIRLNVDPYLYFATMQEQAAQSISTELAQQKAILVEESKRLKLRQVAIDQWEQDIIRLRGELLDLTPRMIVDELYKTLSQKMKVFGCYLLVSFLTGGFVLGACIAIVLKILNRQLGSLDWQLLALIYTLISALITVGLRVSKLPHKILRLPKTEPKKE